MRREILFSLLGFLGGFVVAGFVFWQPSAPSDNTPKAAANAAAETPSPHASASVAAADRSHRGITVSARDSGVVAPVNEGGPGAKGAAETFHEAIGKLKDMDPQRRQAAIDSLVKQLRGMGPEGLQVLRDYFRAGQDVKFPNGGYVIVDGRAVQSGTLRASLLNSLGDWPGNEAVDLAREVLRTTSRMSEASAVIAMLEKKAPGAYRAEAIQVVQQLAEKPGEKDMWAMNGGSLVLDTMRQYKATELLPAAEAFVTKNPMMATQFIASLDALPADVRTGALQRLFANEAVTKNMAQNPWALQQLNYSEPVVAQNVAQMFAANPDKRFRESFLQTFANTQMVSYSGGGLGMVVGNSANDNSADRVARLQGRLSFLDQIAPHANTPVLQERLQDARTELQKAITSPPEQLTKRGAGTLILDGGANVYSGSTTIITPGAVQFSTSTDKK